MRSISKLLIAAFTALGVSLVFAQQLPGPIVTADWLAANQAQVQLVDVRSDTKSYSRQSVTSVDKKTGKVQVEEVGGVIPGALLVDYALVRSEKLFDGQKTKYLIPDREELESRLRAAGLRSDKPIVIAALGLDPSDVVEALRLYWTLKVFGEDRVAVLDGGSAGWLVSGRVLQPAGVAPPAPGNWATKGYRATLIAGSADVEQASKSSRPQLIDGRESAAFYGLAKRSYVNQYGHIANAKSLPPELMFRSVQGAQYFLTHAQYQTLAKLLGVDATAPAISYCNSGNLASGAWFVFSELLGNANVRLYDGSLYLWSREGRPLVGVL